MVAGGQPPEEGCVGGWAAGVESAGGATRRMVLGGGGKLMGRP